MDTNKRIYLYLILITSISAFAIDMIVPALPDIQRSLRIDNTWTQLLISEFLFIFAISQFCVDFVGDRVEKTWVLTFSLIIFILGCVICFISKNIELLLVGRTVQAIGAGAGPILSRAIAKEVFHEDRLKSVLSDISSASAVVPLIATVVGGVILQYSRWQSLFLFMAFSGTLIIFTTPRIPSNHIARAKMETGRFVTPQFVIGTLLVSTVYSMLFCFISISPAIFINDLALTPTKYSMIFSDSVFFFILGNQLSKFRKNWNLTALFALNLLVALPFLINIKNIWPLLLTLVVLNLTLGVIFPTGHYIALQIRGYKTSLAASITGFVQTVNAALVSLFFVKLQSGFLTASQSLGVSIFVLSALSIARCVFYRPFLSKNIGAGT